MKLLTAALVLSALTSTHSFANRDDIFLSTSAPVLGTSMAPFLSGIICSYENSERFCADMASASYLALSVSTSVLLKEEIKTVESDSYDFLAGEAMTLALEEVVKAVRASENFDDLSDEVVVSLMLKSL